MICFWQNWFQYHKTPYERILLVISNLLQAKWVQCRAGSAVPGQNIGLLLIQYFKPHQTSGKQNGNLSQLTLSFLSRSLLFHEVNTSIIISSLILKEDWLVDRRLGNSFACASRKHPPSLVLVCLRFFILIEVSSMLIEIICFHWRLNVWCW